MLTHDLSSVNQKQTIFIDLFTFVYIMLLWPLFQRAFHERRQGYNCRVNLMNIGIFGGSFNPIHIGHLIAAEEVFQQRALSKILFVPTGISPIKMQAI